MPTDWNKIRELLNTVIDTCEQVESLSSDESKRSQILNTEKNVTVSDLLSSLRTYPENLSYAVIHQQLDEFRLWHKNYVPALLAKQD